MLPATSQKFNYSGSPTPRIKICGMKNLDSVKIAVRYGADAVGFITEVPVKTHRKIDRTTARELVAVTPPFVSTVMVCMPSDLNNALELIEFVRPDAVQIHNFMSDEDLKSMKENTFIKLIKTVNVNEDTDVTKTLDYIMRLTNIADAILLDSSAGGKSGGTGIVHDWTKSKAITAGSPLPVILAGGLHSDNVADALKIVAPYGVDAVSGVETDKQTDQDKVRLFIMRARGG